MEDPEEGPVWWKNTGDNFVKMEKFDEAIQCYQKATSLDPDYISAWNNMGYSLAKLGKKEEARRVKIRIRDLKEKEQFLKQPPEQSIGVNPPAAIKTLIATILGAQVVVALLFIYYGGGFQFLVNELTSLSIGFYTVLLIAIILGISLIILLLKPFFTPKHIGIFVIWIIGIAIISIIVGLLISAPVTGVITSVESNVISGTPPENISVAVQVEKDPIYHTIIALFAGGNGQSVTKYCMVRVTRSDGSVISEQLLPVKLAEVKIPGTSDPDRVEVFVVYSSGKVYRMYDRYLPERKSTPA